jgi:hypothetical protein
MNGGLVLLLTVALGTLIFIIQRTELRRRRQIALLILLFSPVMLWYVNLRQAWGEALIAFFLALLLNFLFWVLVGRYNPVGSSDDIRVLGLDD